MMSTMSVMLSLSLSQEMERQSENSGCLNRNLYVMLKVWSSGPKHRYLSKKTWLSWKGISFLQITFMLFGMKETLIWFNLQKERTINRLLHIKDAFAESVQLQMSVLLHRGICMVKAGLSGLSDGWANIKKKYPICQIPVKMLKQYAILNSSLQN